MHIARVSNDNVDAALGLLGKVVPRRPSLRAALLDPQGESYLVYEVDLPSLAVGVTAAPEGADVATLVRIASARPRDTRRWLEALPPSFEAHWSARGGVECTTVAWDSGAAEYLGALGLGSDGETFYMTTRERHPMAEVDVAPVSDQAVRACFALDRAAMRQEAEVRSDAPLAPEATAEEEADALRAFERATAPFVRRGDLFACRLGGRIAGYVLLDENAIDTVVVGPDLQRRGFGSTLVQFACATLNRRGHDEISLLTAGTNLEAVRLYERMGFRMHSFNRWFHRDASP